MNIFLAGNAEFLFFIAHNKTLFLGSINVVKHWFMKYEKDSFTQQVN
jgi:hypothetical protein